MIRYINIQHNSSAVNYNSNTVTYISEWYIICIYCIAIIEGVENGALCIHQHSNSNTSELFFIHRNRQTLNKAAECSCSYAYSTITIQVYIYYDLEVCSIIGNDEEGYSGFDANCEFVWDEEQTCSSVVDATASSLCCVKNASTQSILSEYSVELALHRLLSSCLCSSVWLLSWSWWMMECALLLLVVVENCSVVLPQPVLEAAAAGTIFIDLGR